MKKNVAGFDKIIRIIAGFAFVIVGIFAPVGMGWRIGSFAVADENTEADIERHADEWIAANRDQVDEWLATANAAAGA